MDASDSSLIREFLEGGREAPFRQLVERYQDMVFSTALRRTGDAGLAEEIAQDVFLVLAARARMLASCPNLAGWLYKTALKKSANRMKSDTRRERREEKFATESMAAEGATDVVPPMAFALVDEALASLRAKDREALLLRYFQGLGLAEVGSAQGASADAARKRVGRALSKVEGFLKGRGVVVPSAVAAAALQQSTHAAPAGFASAAAGVAAAPATSALSTAFTSIITMTKTQTAIVATLVVATPIVVQQAAISKLEDRKEELVSQAEGRPAGLSASRSHGEGEGVLSALTKGEGGKSAREEGEWDFFDDIKSIMEDEASMGAIMSLASQGQRAEANKLVDKIVAELALDEATAAKVRGQVLRNVERQHAAMGAIWKAFNPSLKGGAGDGAADDLEAMDLVQMDLTPEEMLRGGVEMLDGVEAFLSDEQMEQLEKLEEKEEEAEMQKFAENMAYSELADLQELLQLTDEQKDQALAVFQEEWASWGDWDDEDGGETAEPDGSDLSPAEIDRKELEEKLKKFSEFLDSDQLGVYRKYLEEEMTEYSGDAEGSE